MNKPEITIITPSYNRVGMIEAAIKSVLSQNYSRIEHIIVDGGSTDGTLELLKKYPHLLVISEPDQGMYDALNKGLNRATGEIIAFLNSDDYFAPDVFSKIVTIFNENEVDAVAGFAEIVRQKDDQTRNMDLLKPAQGDSKIMQTILGMPIFNAYFFCKKVFQTVGKFDTRYKIIADRDFMMRFVLGNLRTYYLDYPVYYYLQHSESMTVDYSITKFKKIVDEHLQWSRSYLNSGEKYPDQLVSGLVELRTRDTIRVCAHCLRQMDFKGAWFYLKEGVQNNPGWFIRFLKHAFTHPIRQLMGLPYRVP